MINDSNFEWDDNKNKINQKKHGVSFALSQLAFLDHNRIILKDLNHSTEEERFYCLAHLFENSKTNIKFHLFFMAL